jgi:hypothetical protein
VVGVFLVRRPYAPRRAADTGHRQDVGPNDTDVANAVVDQKPSILDFDAKQNSPNARRQPQ